MRRWSLKLKFGIYAATLSIVALIAGAAIVLPTIYFRQRAELDRQLKLDSDELFRDLDNFRGAPINARSPLGAKFLPVAMQDRLVILKGPEGQLLYASPGIDSLSFTDLDSGYTNGIIGSIKMRIGVFDSGPYRLELGSDLKQLEILQRDLLAGLAIATPLVGLIVFFGGFHLGKYAVRPVAQLTEAAERISVNRLDDRLPTPLAKDEIARLTDVLNDAFDRLTDSYEAAVRFSADASHQLKTPIAVMRTGLEELLNNGGLTDEQRSEVNVLLRQTRRLNALVLDLLLLAQADSGRLVLESTTSDLSELLRASIDDLNALVFDRSISIEHEPFEVIPVKVDKRRIQLALQNLIENAAKYTPNKGKIQIRTEVTHDRVDIYVSNTGQPISPEDQPRIFERFRRGTPVGENVSGHGLGLNIARALLTAHDGDLELSRSDETMTEFKLSLPLAR